MGNLFSREGLKQPDDNRVPKWASKPMWDLANYFDEVSRISEISIQGSQMVQDFPTLLDILGTEEPTDPKDQVTGKLSITEIRARADFAKNEQEKGYPTLHAHALIAQWAALETFVEDLCVTFLVNNRELLTNDVFAKVKVPLAEFQTLDDEERCRFLLGEIERLTAARRHGTERFEALLQPVGLSGPVEEDIKKSVYATHHIRNVLVHRGSIADRSLVEKCPWLGLKVGDRVLVTRERHSEYWRSLWRYSLLIVGRVRTRLSGTVHSSEKIDRNDKPK